MFAKSARNGMLKNFQDGISMPIGRQETQRTKVDTVLWDTLYIFIHCIIGKLFLVYLSEKLLRHLKHALNDNSTILEKILEKIQKM